MGTIVHKLNTYKYKTVRWKITLPYYVLYIYRYRYMFNLKTQHSQQDSQSNVKGVLCAIARHKCIQGDTNSVFVY